MMPKKPLPDINGDNQGFWDGCREQQLRFQKCEECGYVRWPPALLCPSCHSQQTGTIVASGKGKIYTFVVYRVPFHPGYADQLPYVVAVVELEEGPRILSNIVGCNPEEVIIDMAVEATWQQTEGGITLPLFKPLQTSF